ncbi:MAG: TolC family protein [bacterium]
MGPWEAARPVPGSRSPRFDALKNLEAKGLGGRDRAEAGGTKAAPELPKGKLTLADCIRIAAERNPKTRRSWEAARAAAARAGQARAAYLPRLDLRAGADRGEWVSSAALDAGREPVMRNTYAGSLGLSYLLFDGGARAASVDRAQAELRAANFQHNTTLQDLALDVEEAYYRLLATRWLRRVADDTVKQTRYHLELARARLEAGVVTRSDVLKAETQRAEAELSLVRARNAVHVAHGRLAQAMGLRVSHAFEVADIPAAARRQELASIESLLDEAAGQRPELAEALARIEASRADVRAARARYWPAITTSLDAGRKDTSFVPQQEEWGVGIALTVPLFEGFERHYRLRQAEAELARSVAEHADLLRGVELEVWTAYWQVTEASQAVEAAGKLVASAIESARVAEGEYENGVASMIDLIDAQTARTLAETRLVQARLDWYTAKARFERAVGRAFVQRSQPQP